MKRHIICITALTFLFSFQVIHEMTESPNFPVTLYPDTFPRGFDVEIIDKVPPQEEPLIIISCPIYIKWNFPEIPWDEETLKANPLPLSPPGVDISPQLDYSLLEKDLECFGLFQ